MFKRILVIIEVSQRLKTCINKRKILKRKIVVRAFLKKTIVQKLFNSALQLCTCFFFSAWQTLYDDYIIFPICFFFVFSVMSMSYTPEQPRHWDKLTKMNIIFIFLIVVTAWFIRMRSYSN